MNRLLEICLLAILALCLSSSARAAQSYDNCTGFITSIPTVITTQGTWCFKQDLATAISSGNAITINTNNVTIDCNDFKLGGLAAGAATAARGIYSINHINATIRHCNIRGFLFGVLLDSSGNGGGDVVEDNRFDGNTDASIYVAGDGSVIRRNQVFDTGGSTANADAYGIHAISSVDILDNTVSGVTATSGSNGSAFGIYTDSDSGGSITGNRVRTLLKDGSGAAYGNYNAFSDRVDVRNNSLIGTGTSEIGLQCFTGSGSSAEGNMISGFATGIDGCINGGGNVILP